MFPAVYVPDRIDVERAEQRKERDDNSEEVEEIPLVVEEGNQIGQRGG